MRRSRLCQLFLLLAGSFAAPAFSFEQYDINAYCYYHAEKQGLTRESCDRQERAAMTEITSKGFSDAALVACNGEARVGSLQGSYVKLLACLEKEGSM